MHPRVDDLEAVGLGRNNVEFTAIGLEKHISGLSGEFEIAEQERTVEIDDGKTILRMTDDEGKGAVGENSDLVGLRGDGDRSELLKGRGIVDRECGGATIEDDDFVVVGSGPDGDGLGASFGAAENGAGGGIDGDELVVGRGRSIDTIAGGREIEGVGERADRDACDLTGRGVKNPDAAVGRADTPDFVAGGVFAEAGDVGGDVNVCDNVEAGEIDDRKEAVGSGDVGVHVEVGTEEGGAMLAEADDSGGDEEENESDVNTWVFGVGHEVREFYMREEGEKKLKLGREMIPLSG